MEQSFIAFLEDSIQKNWDLDALTDYKGATLQYKDVARKIEFALGRYFPGHHHIRSRHRSYPSRIQGRQYS